jgi:formylmethanofuran dehydrogenase subunit C
MKRPSLQAVLVLGAFLMTVVFGYLIWRYMSAPTTIQKEIQNFGKAGQQALDDLRALPSVELTEEDNKYVITDILSEGIQIKYPNQEEKEEEKKPESKVSFPKNYAEPIEIKLDEKRTITIKDENGAGYDADIVSGSSQDPSATWLQKFFPLDKPQDKSYLRYQNDRKTLLYTYQRDRAIGERKLKHWTFYEEGTGEERESYVVEGATLKLNEEGQVEVFHTSEQEIKNQEVAKEVPADLMARAQRTLEKEEGEDMMNSERAPDLLIPKPYYYDKDGNYAEAKWRVEGSKLSLEIKTTVDKYPLALDPTLSFTAPGFANGGRVIKGEDVSSFGIALSQGDVNADGRVDLIVGAETYSTNTGRVYVFYNDSGYTTTASSADVIITGEGTSNYFGHSLTTGDMNADGRTDLIVSAYGYSSNTGRAYIFYNDGSIPTTAATADVIITGESGYFGSALTTGDLNSDGRTDFVVTAPRYSTQTGRAYIFYNDGSIPTTAATADVTITGNATNDYFGTSLTTGDLNSDGRMDLIVGAEVYSTQTGRAYIFYNDGSIPTTAATADVTITGSATNDYFGGFLTTGDLNADGKIDLIVGAYGYSSNTGRAYIFYNDGSIPTAASSADVIITGESGYFGSALTTGDLNSDGRIDLIVGAYGYSSTGRAYIFYNDGSIPTTAATADVIISGEATGSYFGASLITGDFNSDGKNDFVSGAYYGFTANDGKAYIFYSQNGVLNTNRNITGEASSSFNILTTGDLNADGRVDLIVGATDYSSSTGRAYIFYNDGSIPTTAATADVIITGEASGDYFGGFLTTGDLNADGKTDLVVRASVYSSGIGRAYIFYNDGSIPTTAATADVIITGTTTGDYFGSRLVTGDLNADGKVDLIVGGFGYSTNTGRAYIFYNDGSIPTTAATADVIITGGATDDYFSASLITGDLNADGKVDLMVGASGYNTLDGRAYIFYNDGSIPTTAATADVIITGESSSQFGSILRIGDLNADGKTDLVVGASLYSSNTGRAYIFYNDGSIPTAASSADVIITGESGISFGGSLAAGDLNADGKVDLIVGASGYSSSTGRAYIFYNDGSIPTTAATADVIITGSATNDQFGGSLTTGDLNADSKTDLIVGAVGYSSSAGRVYFYEGRENYSWTLQQQPLGTNRISSSVVGEELRITGSTTTSEFGYATASADFNADGKTDLAVGATESSTSGKVYIFYNNGNYTSGSSSADVIIAGETNSVFGSALGAGDLNADGRVDLIVGAYFYSSGTGRAYIFYNDGSIPTTAATADVIITGESTSRFGETFTTGDLNADGKVDLIVGIYTYSSNTGRAYIFYNDGSIPTTAATADVTITGNATNDLFGDTLTTGDLNADGKVDLIVGAYNYSSNTGRAYIFYNDGSIPTAASSADVTITGEANSSFGSSLTTGDLNADSKTDLIVGAYWYSSVTGRAYIFYNDGSIPTTAATADVTITGNATNDQFGKSLTTGDLNADSKVDLIAGAYAYSSGTGRAYIFYNDGSIPTTAATADVTITGNATNDLFGYTLTTGDLNVDGKTDLIVGAYGYSSNRGRVYMYTFNDAATAGGATNDNFGYAMTSGDFNTDGKTDLVVGAYGYSSSTGRAYIFFGGSTIDTSVSSADITITGEASSYFGSALTTGDLNADGKVDLAVGSYLYSSNTGRAYIFYNDGSIPTTAATADVTITGETTNNEFGVSLVTADLNSDGEIDLAVGAWRYSTNTGRAYIFYNDGSIPTAASSADVIITGEATSYFASKLTIGDLNADGKIDLVGGGGDYSSDTGRAYIFYNDGSIPTAASSADVIITGETNTNYFGSSLTTGDINADGKTDLVVGAQLYATSTGRVYTFYNDGTIPTTAASADKIYTGEVTGGDFGKSLSVLDTNFDGIQDVVVGASSYSSSTGRVYTFSTETAITPVDTQAGKLKGNAKGRGSFILR